MKLAVPVSDLVTGSTRLMVESPRIGAHDTRTPWILLWDATLSGSVPGLPIRWVLGGRNLLDWKIAYPAGSGVAADAVPQPGRSIVIGLSASLPDRQP